MFAKDLYRYHDVIVVEVEMTQSETDARLILCLVTAARSPPKYLKRVCILLDSLNSSTS
jgi:hypothetical protein